MERKLTTIVAADIVEFSRLIGEDEEATLAAQLAHRTELIDPILAEHGGRVANTAGDSLLVEFPSAVQAVRATVAMQTGMTLRNAHITKNRRITYRIGINVGDVVEQDGDLLGDAVNIAARLEALAPVGGIVLSRSVRDQVRDRLDLNLADLGEIAVKNISRPVRAFQVLAEGEQPVQTRKSPRRVWMAAMTLVLTIVTGTTWWYFQQPDFDPANPQKMAYVLGDKPSIAVLAFDNLTGDPEQEHVSDGISEDIISSLARLPGLLVIARNSSFFYKGKSVNIGQIAEEQSVQFVLEGSLQQSDDTLRITAQLIDAVSGHPVWADTYDRPREDYFALRDEITREITAELNRELVEGETLGNTAGSYKSMDTWLIARQSIWHYRRWNGPDNQIAIDLLNQILAQEPKSANAHSSLSLRHAIAGRLNWSQDAKESYRLAETHARQAIAADGEYAGGHISLAWVQLGQGRISEGIASGEKALKFAPGDFTVLGILALLYQKDMQVDRSIELFERTVRIDSRAPGWVWENYGEALQIAGRYQDSIPVLETGLKSSQGFITAEIHLDLAVTFDALGREIEARDAIRAALKASPDVTVAYMQKFQRYKDKDYQRRWLDALAKLGLPES